MNTALMISLVSSLFVLGFIAIGLFATTKELLKKDNEIKEKDKYIKLLEEYLVDYITDQLKNKH